MKKSIWWAMRCVFWYWWDYGVPLISRGSTAWWHGFNLRSNYNEDDALADEDNSPREAVEIDVSYWEE